jgi:pimeloyl-ACP methyl ester carboxylesterase
MMNGVVFALCSALATSAALAESVPSAISADPQPDRLHPAKMTVLHIPSHGVSINGLVYQPSGAGPHPTLVICHGLPGNEKNLDLAQAVRRSGWNAVTFNYRGSWGSPGHFSFSQNLEDADAVLAFLRDPAQAASLGIDTKRLAIAGHSMGGWVAAHTASHDRALIGAILISPADMGRIGEQPRKAVVAEMADDMESLAGVTAESMADEDIKNATAFKMTNAAPGLVNVPLLALTSDDGLAPDTQALVKAIREHGGKNITERHVATDHSWSDHRIMLETIVVTWLETLHSHR